MVQPRLIILQATPYCNINCSYCYLGHRDDRRLMSCGVLDAVCRKILAPLAPDAAPAIVWHAGEPTAAPIRWYEEAHARLVKVAPKHSSFAMQSNGVAIDDRWIDFFRRSRTNVSLSIDGPQRFHDMRRRTRNDKPTWALAMRGLHLLQEADFDPRIITVLHPDGLACPQDYFDFYRDHGITQVSFSVDEQEGAHKLSSFGSGDYKDALIAFMVEVMSIAFRSGYPLHIREVERIAQRMAGMGGAGNEQVEPWAAIVIAADGSVTTFSPEFMEVEAPAYGNFIFGNILDGDIGDFANCDAFCRVKADVAAGIAACKATCQYFDVCGGGSPVNKFSERCDLTVTETNFCRLTTQSAADSLVEFLARNQQRTALFAAE